MKERYLDIMCQVVSVYGESRIKDYITKTAENSITEHGFPRLCANIGILIAHGRMLELKPFFEEMMEICCRDIPSFYPKKGKRGNDFSVREIISCILELEAASIYPQKTIQGWRQAFCDFNPKEFYCIIAPLPPRPVNNWAAFNAASEQIRSYAALSDNRDFIENQIASQMFSFDENGMYRDPNDPMVYDLVTRDMLSTCLHYGYNGAHKQRLENNLRKAAIHTLHMQSVTGEIPYGGRSNQFLHNEAHLALAMEYEASAHKQAGDNASASRFKAAANLALDAIERWLSMYPSRHIKNLYPADSMIGCEDYAYYDKYMVTTASFLYLAYQFCDDSIHPTTCPATEDGCYTWRTSDAFRKVFCKNGPYFVEAEWCSDPHYDASGIGRIHRRGAPSAICLSVPASLSPNYKIAKENPLPLSICCGAYTKFGWQYCSEDGCSFNPVKVNEFSASNFTLIGSLTDCNNLTMNVSVDEAGVNICLVGTGTVGILLPAFWFDGEKYATIAETHNRISIGYQGWNCHYTTDGYINNLDCICANRNGKYKMYRAEGKDELHVNIRIDK